MKRLPMIAALLFTVGTAALFHDARHSFARGNGGAPQPSCSPGTPSQATAAGFTKLFLCQPFATNQAADIFATGNPGFQWYNNWVGPANEGAFPANQVTNDGTGITLGGGNSATGTLATAASINKTPPAFQGAAIPNGFYVEGDIKYNPSDLGTAGDVVIWLADIQRLTVAPTQRRYLEIDCAEAYHTFGGQVGNNVYDWINVNQLYGYSYTGQSPPSAGVYHTYGCMWQPANQNGGTGTFTFYTDNVQKFQLTYSNAGINPTCNFFEGGLSTCGNFMDFDTDQVYLMINPGGAASAANYPTYRNLHVWVKP